MGNHEKEWTKQMIFGCVWKWVTPISCSFKRENDGLNQWVQKMLHTEVDIDSWTDMNTSSLIAADERIGENNINYISHSQRPWQFSSWNWPRTATNMQSVGPDQADLFLLNLRCIATRQIEVLACSGRYGIYVEPRTGPHDELLRIQQCKPQMVGLARLGTRWGLRSKVEDAAALAKQHKPGSVFLGAGPRMSFEIRDGPFDGVHAVFTMELASTSAPPLSVGRWFAWEHWAGSCLCAAAQLGCQVT